MKVTDFNYNLPEKYIAQYPPKVRGTTNLLVIDRNTEKFIHSKYNELDKYLNKGDCIVLNNTKVIPARLYAFGKDKNKRVEIFLLKNINPDDNIWEVMIGGASKIKNEQFLLLEDNKTLVEIIQNEPQKVRMIKFPKEAEEIIEKFGHTPLPPYIKRPDKSEDVIRYQTIFAEKSGAVAAPTASLNFTDELINKLKNKGVRIVYVTLHVGWDTFAPVNEENVEEHEIHSEWFSIGEQETEIINEVKKNGNRIIAVGTTVTRALETVADKKGNVHSYSGNSKLFIYPRYKYKTVDILLTNFHAPKTTVLMLTAAFCGKDVLFKAYEEAKKKNYKFLSYGDSMLIK